MFSNKFYKTKIAILLLLCIALCGYEYYYKEFVEEKYEDYLDNPREKDGEEISLLYGLVEEVGEDSFELEYNPDKEPAYIKGKIDPALVGERVSVRGIFNKNGFINMQNFHHHKGRIYKKIVSIFAVIIAFGLFFREFKIKRAKHFLFQRR